MLRFLFLVLALGALLVGGVFVYKHVVDNPAHRQSYRLEKVARGDLHITVGATGTLEPEEVVDVGAQVAGRIANLGKDPRGNTDPKYADIFDPKYADKLVDYGSPVDKGMMLALIDPAIYQSQYDQATATLAQANANVQQMQAQVLQTEAEWKRAQALQAVKLPGRSPTGDTAFDQALPIKGISDADYIAAEAAAEGAKANLTAAKATVMQQTATQKLAETNLKYTEIDAPISGTIIDRRVNVGQTVVSSLNTPSLFLLARDLRRMQVWASVNEADIAKVKPGTKVKFRVDAYPQDVFNGVVFQIRLNASMTQNVVIYTVVISVDNSDLRLLPYLTADVKFHVDERKDALLVPNSALRFHPSADQIDSNYADAKFESPETSKTAETPKTTETPKAGEAPKPNDAQKTADAPKPEDASKPGGHSGHHGKSAGAENEGRVWIVVPETGKVRPVDIQIGLSDGASTEITSKDLKDLKEGDDVVVGEQQPGVAAASDVNNPFAPPKFGGRRGTR